MEAEYAELVGNEVQTPKEEGMEWDEDGRSPHPNKRERGKLQRAKRIVSLEPAMPKMVER